MPLLVAALAVGCGGGGGAASAVTDGPTVTATPSGGQTPLGGLAGREVVLLPVQRVELPTGSAASDAGALREMLDRELAFALGERGIARGWTMAEGARSIAARNPSMGLDPEQLPLPPSTQLRGGSMVLEPLAGQLRSLAALAGARYAVVPLMLAASSPAGASQATDSVRVVLHLIVADVRTAQLVWVGDTAPVELPVGSPSLAARVAASFADLVAPPGAP